jgi:hypothetical protein
MRNGRLGQNRFQKESIFVSFSVAERPERDDEIILPVDDGYNALPEKTREICRWAKSNGYRRLLKTDDDCYTQLDRLLAAVPER